MMDLDLLNRLYACFSPSGGERKMRKLIRKEVMRCGAAVTTDPHGNLLVVKGDSCGGYPCVAAHMDQVQRAHSRDFSTVVCNGMISGWSRKAREQQGLGADDKNGIYVCLKCLEHFDKLKAAFFVSEEVGCVGSSAVDMQFFDDVWYVIEPDRKSGYDLITDMACGKNCSDEFIADLDAELFGYRQVSGSLTDVSVLLENGLGVSVLNLSCGYYRPHTDNEFTILDELENCLNFVTHIITKLRKPYPFTLAQKKFEPMHYWNVNDDDELYFTFLEFMQSYPTTAYDEACYFLGYDANDFRVQRAYTEAKSDWVSWRK